MIYVYKQGEMDKLSLFQIIDFVFVLYLFQVLFTVQQTRVDWAPSVRKAMIQFTLPEIWRWHTLLVSILTESADTKISEWVSIWAQKPNNMMFGMVISLVGRVFVNGPGDGFNPRSRHTKDFKNGAWYLLG